MTCDQIKAALQQIQKNIGVSGTLTTATDQIFDPYTNNLYNKLFATNASVNAILQNLATYNCGCTNTPFTPSPNPASFVNPAAQANPNWIPQVG